MRRPPRLRSRAPAVQDGEAAPPSEDRPLATRPLRRRRRRSRWPLVIGGLVLLLGGAAVWRQLTTVEAAVPLTTVAAATGDLAITVSSSGAVQPARSADLTFQASGTVQEVLVKAGDVVTAGQVLARLDAADLDLAVQQAEASLVSSQATLAKVESGTATPQDLASAKASLRSAQAQYEKTRTGNVTAADIESAEANLRSAQANLDALRNPSPQAVSNAQVAVAQAETNLENVKLNSSVAKTRAQGDLDQAANAVRAAQDALSTAYWDTHNADGSWKLAEDDPRYQDDVNTYNAAVRDEQDAQTRLQQAQLAYDQAVEQERLEIEQAQIQLDDAQRQLEALQTPEESDLIQAQAQVDQARASLTKLKQGGTRADLTSAAASIEQAQANLEKLTAPASESDLAIAQASVKQAEVNLARAQLDLQDAVLKAPFGGVITAASLTPGLMASSGTAAFTLVDRSALHIDLNLSESDIAKIELGQAVRITFDAIADLELTGAVSMIASTATVNQNVVTYLVQVSFDPGSTPVKLGMTANAQIVVQQLDDVMLVPSRAIQRQAGGTIVQILPAPSAVPVSVAVQTGLSNGTQTQIVSCQETGNLCLRAGDQLVVPATTSSTGTTSGGLGGGRGGLGDIPGGGFIGR